MRTNTRAATLTTIHTAKKGRVSCDQALADLLERLDRMLQAGMAGDVDVDAGIEFTLCLSLFDDPGREGAVADLRRRSGARSFAELVAFMRTSHLSQAEVDDLGDDLHRRASSFEEADLQTVLQRHLRRDNRERIGRRVSHGSQRRGSDGDTSELTATDPRSGRPRRDILRPT